MRLTLHELRLVLDIELMNEALDVGRLANRGLGSRGIVVCPISGAEYLVAISTQESETYKIAHNASLPKVLGSAAGQQSGNDWRLRTLYADDAASAIMLLGAAVERWKRVVPDESVSPAAAAVINRYFQAYKDDPDRIENPDLGPLNATYLGPVGFNLSAAEQHGDAAVTATVDPENPPVKEPKRIRAWIQLLAQRGFDAAYRDNKKTKMLT